MIGTYLFTALKNISHRGIRSWLTMIGIFIGIASVVALISLGQGLEHSVVEQFRVLGTDKIIITPKNSMFGISNEKLSESDLDTVKKVSGVKTATGLIYVPAVIKFQDEVLYNYVFGLPTKSDEARIVNEMNNYKVIRGRDVKKGDTNKAVVGYDYAFSPSFKTHVDVGDRIYINNKKFEVIGIRGRIGNSADDQGVGIPIDTLKKEFSVGKGYNSLFVQVEAGSDINIVSDRITKALRKKHHVKKGEEDFEVQTMGDLMESFLRVLSVVQAVVIGIAAISLFVGGVGITNTMYTSVLERTRDIGVMKAVGASNFDVLLLFLFEAGLLGMSGGLIGVLLGLGISKSIEFITKNFTSFPLETVAPLWLIIGALAFSFLVGVIAGIMPAKQAANKNPVDSLRYE